MRYRSATAADFHGLPCFPKVLKNPGGGHGTNPKQTLQALNISVYFDMKI
jgi:hypothetical protein